MPSLEHYKGLSDSELETANQKLQAERTKIGEEQDRIAKVRDERYAQAMADSVLDGMSPDAVNVLIEAASAKVEAEAKEAGGGS